MVDEEKFCGYENTLILFTYIFFMEILLKIHGELQMYNTIELLGKTTNASLKVCSQHCMFWVEKQQTDVSVDLPNTSV